VHAHKNSVEIRLEVTLQLVKKEYSINFSSLSERHLVYLKLAMFFDEILCDLPYEVDHCQIEFVIYIIKSLQIP